MFDACDKYIDDLTRVQESEDLKGRANRRNLGGGSTGMTYGGEAGQHRLGRKTGEHGQLYLDMAGEQSTSPPARIECGWFLANRC